MKTFKIVVFILFYPFLVKCQDPKLSHFWMDKIGANPALVGEGVTIDINTIYRSQWTRLNSKFQTNSLTGDIYFPTLNGGFGAGFNLQKNIEGDGNLRTLKIEPAFSYWQIFGPYAEASIGISKGLMQKRIENNFQFSDQIDPVLGFVYESGFKMNDSIRTPFNSYSRFGGLFRLFFGKDRKQGQKHITPLTNYIMLGYSQTLNGRFNNFISDESFEVPISQCLHATVNLNLTEYNENNFKIIQPYIILHRIHYKYQNQVFFYSTTIGSRLLLNKVQFYAGYRFRSIDQSYKQDAFITGFAYTHKIGENRKGPIFLNIHYSFDSTLNNIGGQETYVSHEIGLIFKLPTPFRIDVHKNNQGHRRFRGICPAVFF